MIKVDNITVQYGTKVIFKDVSLECEPGQHVCIVGANGSGKSTLLRTITALTKISAGSVSVDGLDPFDPEFTRDVRAIVGYVQQRPDDQLVATSVLDEVAFGPENLGCSRDEIRVRCTDALTRVGLNGFEEREPSSLSGGQKQRLVIAGALAMRPRYILFDEPTSMLDPPSRDEIMQIMEELKADGVGIVHVTHDREETSRADVILSLDPDPDAYLEQVFALPVIPTTKIEHPSKLVAHDVSVTYELGEQVVEALTDMSVSVTQGELIVVTGHTGSGKSTLLKVMAGLLDPTEGFVTLDGSPITDHDNRGKVGLIFQDAESALFAETVREDVAFGPRNFNVAPQEALKLADKALAEVGLDADTFGDRSPFHLSGGEARRVAIAGILAYKPAFILADEPTAGLDGPGRALIIKTLVEATAHSGVIVVTHTVEDFIEYASQVISLD
ncbi:MAG: energy-coupling factor transporter ATPase [Coriobacteriia bacterium]|nr:energy-coupling factor transporter ATPase [Coriobacteriia bacterium]